MPRDRAVTEPEGLTVATNVALLDHDAPPGVASERNVIPPVHIVVFPDIGTGVVLTLMVRLTVQPVPSV